MAKISSSQFKVFLVSGVSMLGAKPKAIKDNTVNVLQNNTHGLGDDWGEHSATGTLKGELSQTGAFFDTGTNNMHEAWKALTNVVRTVVYALTGNTIGGLFVGWNGVYQGSYDAISKVGALAEANATYAVTGQVDRGVILQAHQQQTVDWTNASVDNGASSATGGVGYQSVSQLASLTGFVGVVEHSDDNAAWSTLITFANVTAAPDAQRIAVGGTVKRYLRFRGDVTGSGTITPFVGFARNA